MQFERVDVARHRRESAAVEAEQATVGADPEHAVAIAQQHVGRQVDALVGA